MKHNLRVLLVFLSLAVGPGVLCLRHLVPCVSGHICLHDGVRSFEDGSNACGCSGDSVGHWGHSHSAVRSWNLGNLSEINEKIHSFGESQFLHALYSGLLYSGLLRHAFSDVVHGERVIMTGIQLEGGVLHVPLPILLYFAPSVWIDMCC